jgi:signal transduction histidine kinase
MVGRLTDGALVLGLVALGIAETWGDAPPGRAAKVAATVGALLVAVSLWWRRRAPLRVLAAVLAGFGVVWLIERRTGGVAFAAVVGLLLALYSVGAYAERRLGRRAAYAALAVLAALLAADAAVGYLRIADAVGTFVFFPVAWLLGDLLRGRQLRLVTLEQRAADLERDRDRQARAAVAAERARIAREMHDVLAHSTSMIVVHSGAARQVLHTAPDTAEQLLLSIEHTGRDALAELRRLLGLLPGDDETGDLAPQPGLARLASLIGEITAAGVPVELAVRGDPVPLPPGLDLAAYRIAQEALTNVVKHAGPAHASVTVLYRSSDVELAISDDGAGPGPATANPGRGLVGMRERAALYGGSLTTGPAPGGGYLVQARLPLPAAP